MPKPPSFSNARQTDDEVRQAGIDGGAQPAHTVVFAPANQIPQPIDIIERWSASPGGDLIRPSKSNRLAKLPWRNPVVIEITPEQDRALDIVLTPKGHPVNALAMIQVLH